MTQNTSVGYIPVPTTRTVNSKALSSDISLNASDVGAQPLDATLTTLAGVTTAAGKYPYFSGVDTAGVLDLPPNDNLLINGNFMINQMAVSSYVHNSDATRYGVDMWEIFRSGYASVSSSIGSSFFGGLNKSLQIKRPEGDTGTSRVILGQVIIESELIGSHGKYVTVSGYFKTGANFSGATIEFQILTNVGEYAISSGAGTNTLIGDTTLTPNTNLTRFAFTSTSVVPSDAKCIKIVFFYDPSGTAGADDSFTLETVKVEIGNVATQFEFPSYDDELLKCQRYFQMLKSYVPYERFGFGVCMANNYARLCIPLAVPMRATPTVTTSPESEFAIGYPTDQIVAVSTFDFSATSEHILSIKVTIGTTALTAGFATQLSDYGNNLAWISLSARL